MQIEQYIIHWKQGGTVESILSFLKTLSMYCMKAQRVFHFKGNWTQTEEIPSTLPSLWLFQFRSTASNPHGIRLYIVPQQ